MAYNRKTWKNRSSQYPTRRRLAKVSESDLEMVVDVSREEGTISQTGDQFSASSMNDLEERIEAAFNDIPDIPEGIIGDTDISEIADGTLTGAVAEHDEDITDLMNLTTNIQAKADASLNNQAKDIEPGNTATSAHSKGDYIIYGSSKKFAEVLSNISIGDTLSNATGGNIKDITQGEVLTKLNSDLNNKLNKSNIYKISKAVAPWAQSSNYAYAVQISHNFGNAVHQTFCTVNDAAGNTITCITVSKGANIDSIYIYFKEQQTGNKTFDVLAII